MNAKELIALGRDANCKPRSYSGRGMYGKQCVGFSEDDLMAFAGHMFLEAMREDDQGETAKQFARLLKDARTDSMGRGFIVYFPRLEWPEDESEWE